MRTAAVFTAGMVLWFTLTVVVEKLFFSDDLQLIHSAMGPSVSPETARAFTQLLKRGSIDLYLINPTIGLLVGGFVGLVQKRRPALVAGTCLLTGASDGYFGNGIHLSSFSVVGLLRYLLVGSLPILSAALAAALCARLRHRETKVDP